MYTLKSCKWPVFFALLFFARNQLEQYCRTFHHKEGHCMTCSSSRRQTKVRFRATLESSIHTTKLLTPSRENLWKRVQSQNLQARLTFKNNSYNLI